jgi:hypothetical protein
MEPAHRLANANADTVKGIARRYLRRLERYPMLPRERRSAGGTARLSRAIAGWIRLWRIKA